MSIQVLIHKTLSMGYLMKTIVVISLYGLSGILAHDADTLEKLVFEDSSENIQLSPEEMVKYMDELRQLKPERSARLSSLIKLSGNHEEKCDLNSIAIFQFLLKNAPAESKGLRNYEEQEWAKRVSACKETWKSGLIEGVNTLAQDDQLRIMMLKKSIMEANPGADYKSKFLPIKSSQLATGILPYFEKNLQHKVDQLLHGRGHREIFETEYGRLVRNLCTSMEFNLKKSIELYKQFIYTDLHNTVDDDDFVHNWLENIEVCKTVTDDSRPKEIRKEVYKLLKKKHQKSGCLFGHKHGSNIDE